MTPSTARAIVALGFVALAAFLVGMNERGECIPAAVASLGFAVWAASKLVRRR